MQLGSALADAALSANDKAEYEAAASQAAADAAADMSLSGLDIPNESDTAPAAAAATPTGGPAEQAAADDCEAQQATSTVADTSQGKAAELTQVQQPHNVNVHDPHAGKEEPSPATTLSEWETSLVVMGIGALVSKRRPPY